VFSLTNLIVDFYFLPHRDGNCLGSIVTQGDVGIHQEVTLGPPGGCCQTPEG